MYARLTDRGFEVLAEATPTHIAGVRERFLDRLSEEQTKQLAAIWRVLLGPDVQRQVLESIHRQGLDTVRKEKS